MIVVVVVKVQVAAGAEIQETLDGFDVLNAVARELRAQVPIKQLGRPGRI